MSEFEINWLVNINDEKSRLNVTGKASYTGVFSKEELSEIQKLYKDTLNFESCIKINNVNYKYREFLKLEWEDKQNKELGIIMFNPSFASPYKPDDTARNAVKFAHKICYNKITIVYLLPIRISNAKIVGKYYNTSNTDNTDLKKIRLLNDFINEKSLKLLPTDVVIAWGKLPKNINNINVIIEELKNKLEDKTLYQITNEKFQRHLSSSSINRYGRKNLGKNGISVKDIYTFNKTVPHK